MTRFGRSQRNVAATQAHRQSARSKRFGPSWMVLVMPLAALALGLGCGSSDEEDTPDGGSGGGTSDAGDASLGGAGGSGGSGGSGGVGGSSATGGSSGSTGGSGGSVGGAGGSTGGSSGATGGSAGTTGGAGGSTGGSGGATGGTAGATGGTGGSGGATGPCVESFCVAPHQFACGDCIDNDQDGLTDMYDPDCLGPCDNNEAGFDLDIPGGSGTAPCKLDCYFDDDTGSGNDECYWNHTCNPLSVPPNYYPQDSACEYAPGSVIPPTGLTCEELELDQTQVCLDTCLPLVPNGCDCFGCCELPAESGNYVWLGSYETNGSDKIGTCDLASQLDETKCHPCTPVEGCLNDCGHCELCLGKTELPPDCFDPPDGGTGGFSGSGGAPPDGGTGGTGGSPPDSGSGGTGGDPCGGQICPPGSDPCGLACQPPCPDGYFCLTGCCQKNPS